MSSLEAASKITTSARLRARCEAGIRRVAATKAGAEGPPGALAAAAATAPDTVAAHFLIRLELNDSVAAAACLDCGYPDVDDQTIIWVITDAWDQIAARLYPQG